MELLTRLADGTEIHAVPAVHADVFEQLHDATHALVAEALAQPSPTLHRLAHGLTLDDPVVRHEEAAVLAITAYMRALHG